MSEEVTQVSATNSRSRHSWWKRLLKFVFAIVLTYCFIVLVGLIPVNNGFEEAGEDEGITIYITSNAVHADIIVPTTTELIDWRKEFPASDFKSNSNNYTHVAFGWGDRGFYLNTPEWKDLKTTTVAHALLWPSQTVMHVQWTRAEENERCRAVTISSEAYQKLIRYIQSSFRFPSETRLQANTGDTAKIDVSYNRWDAFYPAHGNYHVFNTCNCWVGGGLKETGVRVPWFSPLPKTVFWYLPE